MAFKIEETAGAGRAKLSEIRNSQLFAIRNSLGEVADGVQD